MANAVDTLLLPLEDQDAVAPVLFFNAARPEAPGSVLPAGVRCEQPHRGAFLMLQQAGLEVVPAFGDLPRGEAAMSLVLAGRHRRENEWMIARASAATRADGMILVAGDKTAGILSLRKFASRLTETGEAVAKHHAQVFRCSPSAALTGEEAHLGAATTIDGFVTAPGMFSSGKIDTGSQLLADIIDQKVTGAVADFGAGWGYLSRAILQKGKPTSLALYESHWPSLEVAEKNIAASASACSVSAHWLDLTMETVPRQFDWLIMNPPFHAGRKAEPSLGERFIQTASKALKPGGRLLMVANQTLGYERTLETNFSRFAEIGREKGFKLFLAHR